MNEPRQNGTGVDEAVAEAAQAEAKARELLTLKARFFDLLKSKELHELEMKRVAQKIDQLEKGNA